MALHTPLSGTTNVPSRATQADQSADTANEPQREANVATDASDLRNAIGSLWATRGDTPASSDTTLRYGAPILASMCGSAPALCVPDEYVDAVRNWPAAMNPNARVDGNADSEAGGDATRFPLASASPWAPFEAGDESRFVTRSGPIEHDLHDALTQADLPADIVAQLEHLFAGRLDAPFATMPGGGFRIIYERADQSDAVTRHPRLTAAEVQLGDRTYTALWFVAPGSTHGEYYAFDGSLLPGEPFAMPVNYDRISLPFGVRMHPVFGEERFHTGVDLTARSGAPVLAAAAGTVEFVGVRSGYGRHIVIDHGEGYTTCYAHLSSFARGLREGMKISQGERIGAVGRTGVATGPHLHYEVRINDEPVDPLKLTGRDFAAPLTPAQRFALTQAAGAAQEQLTAISESSTRLASTRPAPLF
ncbi:M23 family metallopeptidase [Paraburkholderia sp. SARCC-3016]|uniref:M23 family metallopeptidase n=1 Tax=Paraburkholderia sp. SARCC-3016 TaxID=3058611 RepID=UPI002809A173|nr:M23 family metallopeptidase [Paraburkholderia sp. SARCC-3016]MDQ7977012.1 M23 family metallopeptidase [Paraburkholderia sp. SARCC-3016]